jgi:hypothetical protein
MKSKIHEYKKNNFKSMRNKIILIIALTIVSNSIFAQSAFEKYERDENVTSFIAGKKTFEMLAKTKFNSDDEKIQKGKELLNEVESIEVYTTENQSVASDMKTTVTTYAKSAGLEELMQIKNSGKSISIMIKQGESENIVTQVLVFIGNDKNQTSKGNESIIVLINGNFNLDHFSEMISDKTVTGDTKTDDKKFTEIKDALELKVSPNPASGTFFINTDKAVDVQLFDLSGRLVKQQTYTNAGISISDLAPATYIVEITSGDMRQTQKIIIK